MGTTLANLQLRISGAADIQTLRALLDRRLAADGLVPTDNTPDRVVLLRPGAGWLGLYDPGHAAGPPDGLLEALSEAIGPAMWVLVHDSDVLQLTLAAGGRIVDTYNSNPGFPDQQRRGPAEPHARAWSAALGVAEARLLPVFSDRSVFAEAALTPLAAALGIDPGQLGAGPHDPAAPGTIRLGYRLVQRPSWETPYTGPTRLRMEPTQAVASEVAVGAHVRLPVAAKNLGGAARGLRVEVEAPVDWTVHGVELGLGDPRAGGRHHHAGGTGTFSADFPEVSIPAGRPDPDAHAFEVLGAERAFALRFASQVMVTLTVSVASVGQGVCRVRLVPGGEETGAAELSVSLRATSTEHRPLRAPASISPLALAPLSAVDHLVALVVGPDARALAGLVPAVAPALPSTAKLRWTTFPRAQGGLMAALTGAMRAPKLRTVKAAGFLGAPWARLVAEVPDQVATLQCEWVDDAESREPAASVHLGVGLLPTARAVPAITLSISARGDRDAAEATLVATIDTLAAQGGVIQAFVCRWGQPIGLDFTPYEMASGVMGQCTLERPWVERWLRGIGRGTLWIGPTLRARLAREPEGTRLGDVLQCTVDDVAATERELAVLLPSAADWQAGVAARYR